MLGLLTVEFGVLGPITAWSDGQPLSIGGPRQRCVLGVLLAHAGREVTFDRLITYLWSAEPPRTARSVIQVQISHLRRLFPEMISTTSGGYLVTVDPERVDLYRFRRLRGEAGEIPAAHAFEKLSEALECWRGVPFSGVGSEHLYYSLVSPLLEERRSTIVDWARIGLELGRAGEVISRLTPITREEPLRERIHHLLISALWQSGERAAALAAYERARSHLADELGVDPGNDLQELHARILREDARGPSSVATESTRKVFVVRNDLPRDTPDFSGREDSFRRLTAFAEKNDGKAKVCVITGSGGTGKTTIAVRAGHRSAARYQDGQLFIDLYGYTPGKEPMEALVALGALLRAVGVNPENVPEDLDERSALWRATLMGRRLLVILDNARSYAQVLPLLPSSPESLTLITSRNDLSGLSGAGYLGLGTLGEDSSLELLAQVLGPERVLSEPQEALEVARLCGGLPLALRVVGARMLSRRRWTFAHVVRRLAEQNRRLQELQIDGQSVEAAINLSYKDLAGDPHRAFLLLGAAFGRSVDLHGAAALLGVEPEDADEILQDLVSVCLLDEPHADVYRFHDLVGDFARQRSVLDIAEQEVSSAQRRHAEYFIETTRQAAELLGGPRGHEEETDHRRSRYHAVLTNRSDAESWFALHQDNIVGVVEYFAARGDSKEAWQLADAVWRFYALRGRLGLLLESQEQVLKANSGLGNERGRAVTLIGMGIAYCVSGHFGKALDFLQEARGILMELGDQWGMVRALCNLAMVYERIGRFRDAGEVLEEVLGYAVDLGDKELEALLWSNLAVIRLALADFEEAFRCAERTLRVSTDTTREENTAYAKRIIGESRLGLGRVKEALIDLDEALEISLDLQLVGNQIYVYNAFGIAYRAAGRLDEAIAAHERSLELANESGDRSGDAEILVELGVTLAAAQRYVESSQGLEKALAIATERDERYMAARASLTLGRIPEPVMKADRARELLTEALRAFEELDLPEVEHARAALQALES